jgi:hypothetical protein
MSLFTVHKQPYDEEEFSLMKRNITMSIILACSLAIVAGCAPSVSVTPAGHDRQYEVTVTSTDFTFGTTEEMLREWHGKAREACGGQDYRVVTRDVINREQPLNETVITGIVECE